MKIGIIGAGFIGSALATRLTSLGHSVAIANSRGPETLEEVAQKTGATTVTAQQAALYGELIVVAIPLKNIPDLPKDLFEGVPAALDANRCLSSYADILTKPRSVSTSAALLRSRLGVQLKSNV